jgi:hypothetical protein
MNEHSDPIEFLIEFAWANGADRFVVNNAKDELKKLKDDSSDSKRWFSCEQELSRLRQEHNKLLSIFEHPVAYGKTNDRNDIYDLRLGNNPHEDQTKVVPLYSNRQEFLTGDWKGYNHYGKFTK